MEVASTKNHTMNGRGWSFALSEIPGSFALSMTHLQSLQLCILLLHHNACMHARNPTPHLQVLARKRGSSNQEAAWGKELVEARQPIPWAVNLAWTCQWQHQHHDARNHWRGCTVWCHHQKGACPSWRLKWCEWGLQRPRALHYLMEAQMVWVRPATSEGTALPQEGSNGVSEACSSRGHCTTSRRLKWCEWGLQRLRALHYLKKAQMV